MTDTDQSIGLGPSAKALRAAGAEFRWWGRRSLGDGRHERIRWARLPTGETFVVRRGGGGYVRVHYRKATPWGDADRDGKVITTFEQAIRAELAGM